MKAHFWGIQNARKVVDGRAFQWITSMNKPFTSIEVQVSVELVQLTPERLNWIYDWIACWRKTEQLRSLSSCFYRELEQTKLHDHFQGRKFKKGPQFNGSKHSFTLKFAIFLILLLSQKRSRHDSSPVINFSSLFK